MAIWNSVGDKTGETVKSVMVNTTHGPSRENVSSDPRRSTSGRDVDGKYPTRAFRVR